MATFKQGDAVAIVARDQTSADIKSGLYYPHYAGMRGTILKVYGEEASVLVDRETLPEGILKRHEFNEKAERGRYLDRLSEAARNTLGEKERNFTLNYAVLVALKDLTAVKGGGARKAAKADEAGGEAAPTKRLTENELSAAEEAFLRERARQDGGGSGAAAA